MLILWLPVLVLFLLGGCGPAQTSADPAAADIPAADTASEAVPHLDLSAGDVIPGRTEWSGPEELDILASGVYELSGSLAGRVVVDADGPVELILSGVDLLGVSCLDIRSGDPVTLTAADGSVNFLADEPPSATGEASGGASGEAEAEAAEDAAANSGAVIVSKAPLTFAGNGAIRVTARVNNALRAKADVAVESGALSVTAANNGLKVTGALAISGGALSVTSGGDGLAAEAGRVTPGSVAIGGGFVSVDAGGRGIDAESLVLLSGGEIVLRSESDGIRSGVVTVTDGRLTIDAQCDGIQAASDLSVEGGELSITTGGGGGGAIDHPGEMFGPWAQSADEDSDSAKGLKSGGGIAITGGTVSLNNSDDSIHCETLFTMDGGAVAICSGDDAIHSGDLLVINDGVVAIDDCFEGLEAFAVEIRGGDVAIRAVNDGINANGPEMMFRRSSDAEEETEITSLSGSATSYVLMAGGRADVVVTGSMQNQGDGIDSNGAVYVTGGELTVSTFGTFMENGIDTGWGGPVVTGGKVIAGGSSTMAEGFSSYSTQCAAVVATSYMPDGTEVVLSDEAGNVLWTVTLADAFSCIQISHPGMQAGHVYTLSYGGESTTLDFTSSSLVSQTRGFGFPF